MNEKHFNIGVCVIVIAIVGYMVGFGNVDKNSVIGILGSIGFNLALLLSIGFGLQYFQLGTDKDIQSEIYQNENLAAAVYQGAIWISIAITISKGLF